jgi:hypothetical protein
MLGYALIYFRNASPIQASARKLPRTRPLEFSVNTIWGDLGKIPYKRR